MISTYSLQSKWRFLEAAPGARYFVASGGSYYTNRMELREFLRMRSAVSKAQTHNQINENNILEQTKG